MKRALQTRAADGKPRLIGAETGLGHHTGGEGEEVVDGAGPAARETGEIDDFASAGRAREISARFPE